jgi:DNA-binding NtrC family response regulator
VRELENAIECAIVMGSTSVLLPEDLPETVTQASKDTGSSAPKFNQMVREMKRRLVEKALNDTRFDHAGAAKLLGLHPNNLYRLMKSLGIKSRRQE